MCERERERVSPKVWCVCVYIYIYIFRNGSLQHPKHLSNLGSSTITPLLFMLMWDSILIVASFSTQAILLFCLKVLRIKQPAFLNAKQIQNVTL